MTECTITKKEAHDLFVEMRAKVEEFKLSPSVAQMNKVRAAQYKLFTVPHGYLRGYNPEEDNA